MAYIISSGKTSTGIILEDDLMIVSSGGTANRTTVSSDGYLCVSLGGTANSTTVNYWGSFCISGGGTANRTTVSGGILDVSSGGMANSTTVYGPTPYYYYYGGYFIVSSGGTANGITVSSGGYLCVNSGGTATNIVWTPCVGDVYVENGAYATFVSRYSGVYFGSEYRLLSQAAVMNDQTVSGWTCEMYVMSGGTANRITAHSDGGLDICSGGTANSTTVNSEGFLSVSSGGTANSTTVNVGGRLYVSSGGTANRIVENGGNVYVSSGANVSFAANSFSGLILAMESATVHSGTTANRTTVNSYGCLCVYSGGTANSTTVNVGGRLYVSSGGTANSTTVNSGGGLYVSNGGTANSTTVKDGGSMFISNGGTANSTTMSGGYLSVSSGGTANSTTMSGGYLSVSSGGTANRTMVNSSGRLYVSRGGTATNIVWTPCVGNVSIDDGAYVTFVSKYSGVYYGSSNQLLSHSTVMYATVLSGDDVSLYVMSGGTANSATVNSGGGLYVSSGGTANSATVKVGGRCYVYSGGTANSTTVNSGGIFVSSGGTANNTVVKDGGWLHVENGGTANSTTVKDSGWLYVSSGGMANSTTVKVGGRFYVYSGGTANSTTANSGGYLVVSSGGTVNGTTVNSDGSMFISSGGTANRIVENGGYVGVSSGANVTFAANSFSGLVLSCGYATIHSGTTANSTTVSSSGFLHVSSGGTANIAAVNSGGWLSVSSGGTANSATVNSGGSLYVSSGGTANIAAVNSGGSLHVNSGGKLTGRMTFNQGGYVRVESDSIIEFDLTKTSAGAALLVNDLSRLDGSPTYRIKVNGKQSGTYQLAGGASGFNQTISVFNSSGSNICTLKLNSIVSVGNESYLLELSGGNLTIKLGDMTSPKVSNVKADISARTEKDVTVTATFSDNVAVAKKLYRIGTGGEWKNYSGGVVLTQNATVYFKAVDTTGNESPVVSCVVSNIIHKVSGGATESVSPGQSSFELIVLSGGRLIVSSGGTAADVELRSGASMWISSGGMATAVKEDGGCVVMASDARVTFASNTFSGLIISGSSVTVHSGTTANNVRVNAGGNLDLYSGGSADSATVNAGGRMRISGGVAASPIVNSNGLLTVSSGGTASKPVVNNGGSIFVYSGGRASSATVKSSGYLEIFSGGTAMAVKESGGCVVSHFCAKVNYLSNSFASMTFCRYEVSVHSGTTANSITLSSGGILGISSGGSANRTILASDGLIAVSQGGTATNIVWTPCIGDYGIAHSGYATLASKYTGVYYGSADQLISSAKPSFLRQIVADGEKMHVFQGGIVSSMTILGSLTVHKGGSANVTTVSGGGYVGVRGDTESGLVDEDVGVWGALAENGKMNVVSVMSDGTLGIGVGGSAADVRVFSGGRLHLAVAPKTFAQGFCEVEKFGGGVSSSAFVNQNGQISDYTVRSLCSLDIHSGGNAENITVEEDAYFTVHRGGSARNVVVSTGAYLSFDVAAKTELTGFIGTSNGKTFETKNGLLSGFSFFNYGEVTVSSGGRASKTTVCSGGELYISSGGSAVNTTVQDGRHTVGSGGVTINPAVRGSWAELVVSNGGKITGKMNFNGTVFADCEAVFEFNIANTSAGAAALVNDLSCVVGLPIYTLTVNGNQTNGTYKLAEGASGFNRTISIVNTSGTKLGSVGVGKSVTISGKTYQLNRSGGSLTVAVSGETFVDKTAPTVSGVKANITSTTSGSVTVTATFSDNVAVSKKLYRIGTTGDWKSYSSGVTVSKNSTVYFKAVDASGNESKVVSYTVSNISGGGGSTTVDKTAPTVSNVKANITAATNKNVTVTATFSDNVAVSKKLYKVGNGSWKNYSNGVTVSQNDTVSFKAVDASGNESKVVSYKVTNIDKTAPAKPTAKANTTAATNQAVTVTATFSKDSDKKQYSLDNKKWSNYSNGVKVTKNGTVYFRGLDAAGNISPVVSYKVTNIDTTPPAKPTAKANTTSATNQAVTVTATFSKDSEKKQYSLDNKKWSTYSNGVKLTKNGTVYFRGIDAAGNISPVASYKVSNIQSTAKTSGKTVASVKNADAILLAPSEQPADFNGIGAEWDMLATGDFNADGKADTLWRKSFVGDDGSWYSAYYTKLASEENDWRMVGVTNAEEWNFLGSGDFDFDGAADIAMIGNDGVVGIWGVQDGGLSSWSILSSVTPEWSFSGIADFNADGTDDIAWCNTETGLSGFWQINNKQLTDWTNIAMIG